ncbi:CbrC family protein [Streptomyces sp. NPDC087228]|uniref:CbrC family protein n=1 Tax=Streptomyces sp. NPDC087228 TaxID=3365772 RepID=UPI00381F9510
MADGSAAERFTGEFTDSHGREDVSEETLYEVTRRTPGFRAWLDPHRLVHCHDVAAFISEAGYSELAAHPEALDRLRRGPRMNGRHDADQREQSARFGQSHQCPGRMWWEWTKRAVSAGPKLLRSRAGRVSCRSWTGRIS